MADEMFRDESVRAEVVLVFRDHFRKSPIESYEILLTHTKISRPTFRFEYKPLVLLYDDIIVIHPKHDRSTKRNKG